MEANYMFNPIYFSMYKKTFSPLLVDKLATVNTEISKYVITSLFKLMPIKFHASKIIRFKWTRTIYYFFSSFI